MKPEDNGIKLSRETQLKVLKLAEVICRMHASVAGDRICQDWSNDRINPDEIFTEQEKKDMTYNHELANSDGEDYDENYVGLGDEMVVSFVIADNLSRIIDEME